MTGSKLARVTIEPDGTEVRVPIGTALSTVIALSGHAVEQPCGGAGTCIKCRVVVSGEVSEVDSVEAQALAQNELAAGVRLACRAKAVGRLRVSVPESSRAKPQKILSQGVLRKCGVSSGVAKHHTTLSEPALDDERGEFERLADCLIGRGVVLKPNLHVIRTISSQLRSSQYDVTAVICDGELIAVEPGDTLQHCYGIAYDLGSTTIVGYLMDLVTGEGIAVSAAMNPQVVYGDDLISRINFATTTKDGALLLQSAVVDAMNRIAVSLVGGINASTQSIYKVVVVGNTCMTHLLLGIDVASLGQSPYVPSLCEDVTLCVSDLGLSVCPQAKMTVMPSIAGFVGSDTVAVMLSTKWEQDGRTRLAVDIGTNGEMALMHGGRTYVCSAAAGPAFEGAGISCGMRGAPGAIDSVVISDDLAFTTINNTAPIGICGSGLVDAVAQMLDAGIIDSTGRMLEPSEAEHLPQRLRERLVRTESGVEFVLACEDLSGSGSAVVLTSGDIRRVQLAKGSIHAAIQTLISVAGASDKDLFEILLAGAFGNYISVRSAVRIGLIPPVDVDRVISIGNAAGAGARLALICSQEMDLARRLAKEAEHIELAVSPQYQMELMERMMFPEVDELLGAQPK